MAGLRPLYWNNQFAGGNLAIMAAPRPAEHFETIITDWKDEGVEVIVSLLEESEIPGLTEAERTLCEELDVEFFSFPVRDKTVPDSADTLAIIARRLADRIASGKSVAIHCRAGIGRSTTLAACVLILLGVNGEVALDMIAAARGLEVPETEAQRQWILGFCEVARRSA
jgi:protein-tyrosine phosphatase